MGIIVIDAEPDVSVTADDLARYRDDYQRDYMFYAGTPPSLVTYIRRRQSGSTGVVQIVMSQPNQ